MRLLEFRYAALILLVECCRYQCYKTKDDIVVFNSLISVLEGVENYRERILYIKRIFCSIELKK